MDESRTALEQCLVDFFAHQVSKFEIFKHRKKMEKAAREQMELEEKTSLSKTEERKLKKLEQESAQLRLEADRIKTDALKVAIPRWLDETADKGLSLSKDKESRKATHLLKFTHSSAPHFSICHRKRGSTDCTYVATESLIEDYYDIAHSNGAYITISKFLLVDIDDVLVIDRILDHDFRFLEVLDVNESRMETWKEGLSSFVVHESPLTAVYTKQIFFPNGNDYHLLAPLFSSSLSEALNRKVLGVRYDTELIRARKARRSSHYSDNVDVSFPSTALQHFGGEHPQNISPLNFGRSGNSVLLSSKPPVWEAQLQLPKRQYDFWRAYDRRAWKVSQLLGRFLKKVKDFNNIEIRDKRAGYTEDLIDLLIVCGAEIRNAKQHSGWSVESNISIAEKHWLDPYRDDEEFQIAREESDWQEEIARQFATWLNRQLKRHGLNVADAEHQEWSKKSKARLRAELEGFDE